MRSWPSWLMIVLGALLMLVGFYHYHFHDPNPTMLSALAIPGAILLAAGLLALQMAYDSWCDCNDCSGGGCDCGHCAKCEGGDCCGQCDCTSAGDSHAGHGHV